MKILTSLFLMLNMSFVLGRTCLFSPQCITPGTTLTDISTHASVVLQEFPDVNLTVRLERNDIRICLAQVCKEFSAHYTRNLETHRNEFYTRLWINGYVIYLHPHNSKNIFMSFFDKITTTVTPPTTTTLAPTETTTTTETITTTTTVSTTPTPTTTTEVSTLSLTSPTTSTLTELSETTPVPIIITSEASRGLEGFWSAIIVGAVAAFLTFLFIILIILFVRCLIAFKQRNRLEMYERTRPTREVSTYKEPYGYPSYV